MDQKQIEKLRAAQLEIQSETFDFARKLSAGKVSLSTDGSAGLLEKVVSIFENSGAPMPDHLQQRIAAVRAATQRIARQQFAREAAHWAWDRERQRLLQDQPFPEMPGVPEVTLAEDEAEEEAPAPELPEIPAYVAMRNGEPGAIAAFLASGADPNRVSRPETGTALCAALDAPGRSAPGIAALIAAGADVHWRDRGEGHMSHWAAGYSHAATVTASSEAEVFACLKAAGSDLDAVLPWPAVTPLHMAAQMGYAPTVAGLLRAGADGYRAFPEGYPQLLFGVAPLCVGACHPDVVEAMLAEGIDPARPDAQRRAPCDWLAQHIAQVRAAAVDDPWFAPLLERLEASAALIARALPR